MRDRWEELLRGEVANRRDPDFEIGDSEPIDDEAIWGLGVIHYRRNFHDAGDDRLEVPVPTYFTQVWLSWSVEGHAPESKPRNWGTGTQIVFLSEDGQTIEIRHPDHPWEYYPRYRP